MGPEQEPQSQPLPIITDETSKRLVEDFGLDINTNTQRIVQNISGETQLSTHEIATQQATSVFNDLLSSNPDVVKVIYEELKKGKLTSDTLPNNQLLIDSATAGAAMVLKAFDIQNNYGLLTNFSKLTETDINTIRSIFEKSFSTQHTTILERVLNTPRIPDQQVALNSTINNLAKDYWGYPGLRSNYGSYVNLGALSMYRSLGAVWPKLFPQGEQK